MGMYGFSGFRITVKITCYTQFEYSGAEQGTAEQEASLLQKGGNVMDVLMHYTLKSVRFDA